MQAVQDPIYGFAPAGIFQMGDESATLSTTSQQGTVSFQRRVVTSKALTAARTLTLPSSALFGTATQLEINDAFGAVNGSNTLTIALGTATDTINGIANATLVFTSPGQRVVLTSDGLGHWTGSIGGGGSSTGLPQAKVTVNSTAGTTAVAGDMTGANYTVAEYTGATTAVATRTAAQLISDGGFQVNQTWLLKVINEVSGLGSLTLSGGNNVTLSGLAVLPINTFGLYLMKVTSATAISMTYLDGGPLTPRQPVALTALGAGVTTGSFPQFAIAGPANRTILKSAATTPGAQLVRTAAQMLADTGCNVGDSIEFRIVQTGAGTLTVTTDAGATVTLTGTMTVATNTFRDFVLTFNTATTATITETGVGTNS